MVEKRHSTIIVVPHTHGRVYKLQISPRTLKIATVLGVAVLILSVISLAASGTFLRQRAAYRSLARENRELKRANERLAQTVAQVQERLGQFEQRTKALAIAAGVGELLTGPLDVERNAVGSGGPLERLHRGPEELVERQEVLDRHLAAVERRLSEQVLLLAHTPTIAPVVGVITDGFGPRIDPITGRPAYHEGLDISVAHGTPVVAPADGVVLVAGRESGLGKTLKLNHGFGYVTVFGHLDRLLVKEGERVSRGQVIGKVGMTGRATGPHLHYEVWRDGDKQNPLHYILDAY